MLDTSGDEPRPKHILKHLWEMIVFEKINKGNVK